MSSQVFGKKQLSLWNFSWGKALEQQGGKSHFLSLENKPAKKVRFLD
jgi:hypothetical protein